LVRAKTLLLATALVLAIVAAYASSLRGEFLWDDDLHITANPTIIGPLGLKEIWTTARANYFPLVLTNFWVQHALWELNPLGYRIVTLAFHVLAALLLWRVLWQLRVPGAWLGAALWALHPVQAESVAWICELKNTQSAVFFLAVILFWIRWIGVGQVSDLPRDGSKTRPTFYLLALTCALLAILSKPSTVMLPVALALCTWWIRRRIVWRDLLPLVPFCALSAIAAGWTIWEQKVHSGASGAEWAQTWPERFAIAGRVVWFYLGKLAWPEPLMFIYPRWTIDAHHPLVYVPLVLAIAGVALLWRWSVGRPAIRAAFFAAAFFVALLFPVLGFFDVFFFRYSFVGDHFQYLASMGPLVLAAAALAHIGPRLNPWLAAMLVITLGSLTAKQSRIYLNNETLWRDAIAHNPTAPMPWVNLADTLARRGKHTEAIATFRRATEIKPTDPHAWNDLGCELLIVGRPAEALACLQRALSLKPHFAETHNNLGNVLRALGQSAAAIVHYRRATELKPDYVDAMNNLGAELAENGKLEDALGQFHSALKLDPAHAATHDNLGSALQKLRRFDEAIAQHREALRLKPKFAEGHANLGRALLGAGRPGEAVPAIERALELKPDLTFARTSYASALMAAGRPAEALTQLERAVALAPKSLDAQQNLGATLAQLGRVEEAIAVFKRALTLAPASAPVWLNLATASGTLGRWAEAAAQFAEAARLAPQNADAHAKKAIALVNAERLKEAVTPFETALQLDPNSAELHDNFAQLLRALGRNREAFEHFEKAADLRRKK
jgi:protein O-mannosyl-transferase